MIMIFALSMGMIVGIVVDVFVRCDCVHAYIDESLS